MSRVLAALSTAVVLAVAVPTAASAGCYGCYAPPPCVTCYQQQVVPPVYRTVNETVMVAPEGVQYEHIPPQFASVQRTEAGSEASDRRTATGYEAAPSRASGHVTAKLS